MATFLKLFGEKTKVSALRGEVKAINSGKPSKLTYIKDSTSFSKVPGSPLSYWINEKVTAIFKNFKKLQDNNFLARVGLQTSDDFRFIRLWWEVPPDDSGWVAHAKGGEYAEFYSDVHLVVKWHNEGYEIKNFCDIKTGKVISYCRSEEHYYKPGLTWTKSTTLDMSFRCMPEGSIFGVSGLGLIEANNDAQNLLALSAIANSNVFKTCVSLSLGLAAEGRKHYEAGLINKNPLPDLSENETLQLSELALSYWEKLFLFDTMNEMSHSFISPLYDEKHHSMTELYNIKLEIEKLVLNIYGLEATDIENREINIPEIKINENAYQRKIVSWTIGVVFGRFSINNEGIKLPEITYETPFKSIPRLSFASLNNTYKRFDTNNGIFSDNLGNGEQLSTLVDNTIGSLGLALDFDLEKYIENKFFTDHLAMYSKSRRQAPIYWQLHSYNKNFSIWVSYHRLDRQTPLFILNDFVNPTLDDLVSELRAIKSKKERCVSDERNIDKLYSLLQELESFRNEIIQVSKFWQPKLDDGVQITAAPLWRLFQHKAWQKKLKQTWEKLEEGEYDWAHLAFSTWPERVLKKCHADRSLAIAHDVEDDLWHEVEVIKGKKKEPVWEWQPKLLSEAELRVYIKEKIATDDRLKLYRSNQSNTAKGDAW
ncbi:BREX-1 system adenine-specific DNA-methyltransferase PglX [Alteromonas sp. DY56-G5]|uniref:hypothetical protein n=1 Tax=Alteromonas sp. DY56-G5 TaxID=2967128 RepID=UPI00352B729B